MADTSGTISTMSGLFGFVCLVGIFTAGWQAVLTLIVLLCAVGGILSPERANKKKAPKRARGQ